jgi:hypothetical protein
MIKEIFILFFMSIYLSTTGCVYVPNYKRNNINKELKVPAQKFKYGKYCGAGHPTFKSIPGTEERTLDLQSIWPPVDDVDLMCYAHDMCYQIAGSQNLICDQTLSAAAGESFKEFDDNTGCRNLVKLIGTGLSAKVSGTEENKGGSKLITFANAIWTLPVSVSYYMLNYDKFEKYGYPSTEGSCFKRNNKKLHIYQTISEFEINFAEYSRGYEKYSFSRPRMYEISIPVPIKQWKQKYEIFEIQRFLNYFGFDAGLTDGVLGKKTISAIKKYFKSNNLNYIDMHSLNIDFKKRYLSRSLWESLDDVNYTGEEKKEKFGYKY